MKIQLTIETSGTKRRPKESAWVSPFMVGFMDAYQRKWQQINQIHADALELYRQAQARAVGAKEQG